MTITSERMLEAKLIAIAEHFELGEVQNYLLMPGSNDNYLVTADHGGYLFKIIVNTTLADVLNGLPFLRRLEEHDFAATAYYLTSSDGQPFYSSPDCDAVALRRLPGTMPELLPAISREVDQTRQTT